MATSATEISRRHESTAVNTFGLTDEPPLFVRGQGATLWDESGRAYVDLVGGSAVTHLGHGNARQRHAIEAALETGILHTGTRLPSRFRADFYSELLSIAPPELQSVHLANSGAEAIETALKAAQHATGRNEVVAFFGAYHGRTRGALAVTASKRAREPFRPLGGHVHFFPYPYPYRPPLPGHDASSIGDGCLEYLRRTLKNPYSGVTPSALVVEAVQGVAGVVVPPRGFLKGVREICDEMRIVLIVDEVWNGFGRTGRWFAFERDGVVPDIVAFGKAASGSLPLSGVIAKPEYLRNWPPGAHTSTFQGNPLSCAAAAENIRQIRDERLLERCVDWLEPALAGFGERCRATPGVGDARPIGAQIGIELVRDGMEPDPQRLRRVQQICLEKGALVYSGGWHGNVLMLVPPLVITEQEIATAFAVVDSALRATAP